MKAARAWVPRVINTSITTAPAVELARDPRRLENAPWKLWLGRRD
jgi:hypothetical protein